MRLRHLRRRHAGDEVDLVDLGHSDEQICTFDPSLLERVQVDAAAVNHEPVEILIEIAAQRFVRLDDGDVMTLFNQNARQIAADFSGTDDDDVHRARESRGRPAASKMRVPFAAVGLCRCFSYRGGGGLSGETALQITECSSADYSNSAT